MAGWGRGRTTARHGSTQGESLPSTEARRLSWGGSWRNEQYRKRGGVVTIPPLGTGGELWVMGAGRQATLPLVRTDGFNLRDRVAN